MTGKEALQILNQLTEIHNFLIQGNDRSAFFYMGILTEELAMKIRSDECSSEPIMRKNEGQWQ